MILKAKMSCCLNFVFFYFKNENWNSETFSLSGSRRNKQTLLFSSIFLLSINITYTPWFQIYINVPFELDCVTSVLCLHLCSKITIDSFRAKWLMMNICLNSYKVKKMKGGKCSSVESRRHCTILIHALILKRMFLSFFHFNFCFFPQKLKTHYF